MIQKFRARTILVIGWVVFLLYSFPGFMSADSVAQLLRARDGQFSDDHPPMMSVVWAVCDALIPGPLGMLLIQTACFLGGAYLLLRRLELSHRAAALGASIVLLLPPVAAVMGVIWKDSQMAAYLMLGTALLLDERRRANLGGLALLFLATAMRHNAFVLTFPLVLLLYSPTKTRMRYPLAVGAWVVITVAASLFTSTLPSLAGAERRHLWTDAIALADITGTVRYADTMSDAELQPLLVGTPLQITHDIQAATRSTFPKSDISPTRLDSFGGGEYIPQLWITTEHVFHRPTNDEEREAVTRAWRAIVPSHVGAYLSYRSHVTAERLGLSGEMSSATYVFFTNVLDAEAASAATDHNGSPSGFQRVVLAGMFAIGDSFLFRPIVYVMLALILIALSLRRRVELALLASGLLGEVALFVLAPTVDYRYSFWLVVGTMLVLVATIARRAGASRH